LITNALSYSDGSVIQTFTWINSYLYLPASNSLPLNALTNRGFDYRMVQIDVATATGNGLNVAEGMLARPPTIVPDPDLSVDPTNRLWQTNVMALDWNDNNGGPAPTTYFPGLDGG